MRRLTEGRGIHFLLAGEAAHDLLHLMNSEAQRKQQRTMRQDHDRRQPLHIRLFWLLRQVEPCFALNAFRLELKTFVLYFGCQHGAKAILWRCISLTSTTDV